MSKQHNQDEQPTTDFETKQEQEINQGPEGSHHNQKGNPQSARQNKAESGAAQYQED